MKLISCYIENFGKLQAKTFEFSDGLNSVLQKNGYGKTTLATFIKAMFYGMPATTKRDLDQNDRKKYTPWQGGAFGGALCFEVNGKGYKVERFFGKKESDDTFVLYDTKTNKQSNDFSQNLGVELFGIDVNAYEKCTFIPQKEIEGGMNQSLSSKLLGMFNGIDNSESLESANKIIDEKRAEIKKQNKTGKLYDVQNQIDSVEQKIANLKGLNQTIGSLNAQIAENDEKITALKNQKDEISEKISAVAEQEKLIANQKYIKENQARKEALEKQLEFYRNIVGDEGLIIEDVLPIEEKYREYINTLAKTEAVKTSHILGEDFRAQQQVWGENFPKKEEIAKAIEQKEELGKLSTEIELIKNASDPSLKTMEKPKNKIAIISVCFAIALLVFGMSMLFVSKIVSVVSFVMGGLFLLYAGFAYFKSYIDQQTKSTQRLGAMFDENDLKKKQESLAEIKNDLSHFKRKYKIDYELTTASLSALLAKVKEYEISLTLQADTKKKIEELNAKSNQLSKEVNQALARFQFPENLQSIDEKLGILREFCTNVPGLSTEIEMIDNNLAEFTENERKNSEIANISDFDIKILQSDEKVLQQKLDALVELRSDLNNKATSIQEEVLGIDDLENDLADLKQQKEDLNHQLKILKKTNEFLQIASDTLSAKFLAPIRQSLNKYLGKFVSQSELELNPDINLNISFDKNGATRELAFLSKGYKGIVDLCIRFAIVDAIFKDEKPFLILDDPFVNLDEEKMQSAMELLKAVAKEYQILYLTCHSSRI